MKHGLNPDAWRYRLVVIAFALLCAFVPWPASWIERLFSRGMYPGVQWGLTSLSNHLPFATLDVLFIGAAILLVRGAVRALRQSWRAKSARPAMRSLGGLTVVLAVVYLVFLFSWGFNYRRVPMAGRVVVQPGPPAVADVLRLGERCVSEVNGLYYRAHQIGFDEPEWRNAALRDAFTETQRLLGSRTRAVPGRVKPTLFARFFRRMGVDGMVNPFGLDVIANPDLLPFERPFVVAHEWSHLAGFAHESEASFVGWLTCVRGPAPAQYSAWLALLQDVLRQINPEDRRQLDPKLSAGPRRDLEAVAERLRRGQLPWLRNATWRAYDRYLKANRVTEGVRSYGAVVTLIARAKFDKGWTPVLRDAPAGAAKRGRARSGAGRSQIVADEPFATGSR